MVPRLSAPSLAEPPTRAGIASGDDGLLGIANALRRLYKETFGRGPTTVRARYADADVVVVCLNGVLTQAERSLLSSGRSGHVQAARLVLQEALEPSVRDVIQRMSGRAVSAAVTGFTPHDDLSVHVVTLGRREETGAVAPSLATI
jgi:uncharacterized protein YbcI